MPLTIAQIESVTYNILASHRTEQNRALIDNLGFNYLIKEGINSKAEPSLFDEDDGSFEMKD